MNKIVISKGHDRFYLEVVSSIPEPIFSGKKNN